MKLPTFLALTPLASAELLGQWEVYNVFRDCSHNGFSCRYWFSLTEKMNNLDGTQYFRYADCWWDVISPNPAVTPANQTNFDSKDCNGVHNEKFSINGGWSNDGFFTIVPTDLNLGAYAFFSFTDQGLANGKVVDDIIVEPAFRVGTFGPNDYLDIIHTKISIDGEKGTGQDTKTPETKGVRQRSNSKMQGRRSSCPPSRGVWISTDCPPGRYTVKNQDANGKKGGREPKINRAVAGQSAAAIAEVKVDRREERQSQPYPLTPPLSLAQFVEAKEITDKKWKVAGLWRYIDITKNETQFGFSVLDNGNINTATGVVEVVYPCRFSRPGTDLRASHYGQSCAPWSEFTVGWGYKADTEGVVMTVCFPRNGTAAFFGWDGIAGTTEFSDSKFEAVYDTGCT
ncbi:hypothetical protein QBC35DRAFT_63066 [Podospora australis]|uniref:Uncharacterized protein n=1 Tax=Podospora australis TaxID=1536484 RepID=A0AAN6WYS3_9PEZI|nr:hypothetical protein QBC35DRAFT_63066 [Podospora australis]